MKQTRWTAKQEKFCLKYCECAIGTEAYEHAYNCDNMTHASIGRKATELRATPPIIKRIGELQDEAMARNETTVDSMVEEFDAIAKAALEDGKYGPAVNAKIQKAKLFGLYAPKKLSIVNSNIEITAETDPKEAAKLYQELIKDAHE